MCLRFMFLLTTRLAAWLRLARREETSKTAEILILRHQLAVLQRRRPRRPRLDWADRALLATLLAMIPKARRRRLRLLVSPDTVLRWHRDIVRRRWAARSMHGKTGRPPEHQGPGPAACPRKPRLGLPQDSRGTGRPWGTNLGVDGMGDLEEGRHRSRATADWCYLVAVPALPGRGDPGMRLLHSGTARWDPGLRPGVIEHASRRIRILGITLHPTGEWTAQQARNLIMELGDQAGRARFMIRDRGSNFTTAFDAVLATPGSGPCSAASRHPG